MAIITAGVGVLPLDARLLQVPPGHGTLLALQPLPLLQAAERLLGHLAVLVLELVGAAHRPLVKLLLLLLCRNVWDGSFCVIDERVDLTALLRVLILLVGLAAAALRAEGRRLPRLRMLLLRVGMGAALPEEERRLRRLVDNRIEF